MNGSKWPSCLLALMLSAMLGLTACGEEKRESAQANGTAPAGAAPSRTTPSDNQTSTATQVPATGVEREAQPATGTPAPAVNATMPSQSAGASQGEPMNQNGTRGSLTEKDLAHRHFALVAVNGAPYGMSERKPELQFQENLRISGRVCNLFNGQATFENGKLTAKNMAATKKLCFEDQLNTLEGDVFMLLYNGAEVTFDGKRLVLRGKGRENDITLEYEVRDLVQ